ncbi:MAG: putative toxin-antitoxin system toxin component, PIN family [Betaproteobacteria bacterium]|nr:putative toxin-antitoxin system toxin component, PIN family [Betaproteobacteria bacterium]
MSLRLALDTNVWLDWLVFDDPAVAPLRTAVASGAAEVTIDAACEAELERVLARPLGKWTLAEGAQAARLAECRRVAHRLAQGAAPAGALPACRDPHDQKFLQLALAARADALVTKDRALLELARRRTRPLPFRIVTPVALRALLASRSA